MFLLDEFIVIKESGEKEVFSESKVKDALRRVGIVGKSANEILTALNEKLYSGITTREIYSTLYSLIDQRKPQVSYKFNLKRALLDLGPAGYVFEDFVSRLLQSDGYETQTRQILEGRCVSHEIDVVAEKNKKRFMIECKFHNEPGQRCRIQTLLYVYARYLDLVAGTKSGANNSKPNIRNTQPFHKPWLITNTKFSDDVIRYADCMDLPLLGWRFPFEEGLEARIEQAKCYPVTVIPISPQVRESLFRNNLIVVKDLPDNPHTLSAMAAIPLSKARDIVERAEYARK